MAFGGVFRPAFRPVFDCHTASGNGLLNSLIAYWPLDESNGVAYDAHSNALHLTDVSGVTSAAGKVYALARQYTSASAQYHRRSDDDSLLSTGDVDFTLAAWVYLDSKLDDRPVAGKVSLTGLLPEYVLRYRASSDRWRWGTGTGGALDATSFGSPSTATWMLIICFHVATTATIGICVNDGTVDSASRSAAPTDTVHPFTVGYWNEAPSHYMDGRVGPVAFWKSAAGAGGVLTAAQRTALYNSGAGLAYSAFTA